MGLWLTNWSNIGPKIMAVSLPWVHKSLSAAILLPDWDTVNGLGLVTYPEATLPTPPAGAKRNHPRPGHPQRPAMSPGRALAAPRGPPKGQPQPGVRRAAWRASWSR